MRAGDIGARRSESGLRGNRIRQRTYACLVGIVGAAKGDFRRCLQRKGSAVYGSVKLNTRREGMFVSLRAPFKLQKRQRGHRSVVTGQCIVCCDRRFRGRYPCAHHAALPSLRR